MTKTEFLSRLSELNWSQTKFSKKSGVHRNTVSKWMTGKTEKLPSWVGAFLNMALALKRAGEEVE